LGKKKPKVRFANVDLDEDEDMEDVEKQRSDNSGEEEEGEDDEFIDILDVLDGKGEIDTGSDAEGRPKPALQYHEGKPILEAAADADFGEGDVGDDTDDATDDGDDSGENSQDNDDEEFSFTHSDTEDAVPEALDDLQNFISTLNPIGKKRKALEGPDASSSAATERSRKQRRLSLKERTEAGAENEFRAQNSGKSVNSSAALR
jgi:U3 small nucleolar RNA-associated protein 14